MYSPKKSIPAKNYDMTVKRIDNNTKEINSKHLEIGDKKVNKKSEQQKKREAT